MGSVQSIKAQNNASRSQINIETDLLVVSNWQFGWRCFVWIMMVGGGFYLSLRDELMIAAAGIVLMGFGIAHGVELCHQALHNTGFTHSRINEVFGVLMGLPLLVSFYEYRISHLQHHAKIGTPEDTEYFDYGDGKPTLKSMLAALTMKQHYRAYVGKLLLAIAGKDIQPFRPKHQTAIRRFYFFSLMFFCLLISFGLLTGMGLWPFFAWALAAFLVATPVHALIELPEHYGCDGHDRDILQNTRSIDSNRFMQWFTNGNNFHVEHHMFPLVPLQHARKIHDKINPSHSYKSASYRQFYKDLFKSVF